MSLGVEEKAKSTWNDVREDSHSAHWLITKVADNSKELQYVASGDDGLESLVGKLNESGDGIFYCGLRVMAVDDRGSVQSVRYRFVMISLITEGVPMIKKAKAGMFKGTAEALFHGSSVYLNINSVAEITQAAIEAQLEAKAGAHRPSHYEFEGCNSPSSPLSPGSSPAPAKKAEPEPAQVQEAKQELKLEEPKKEEEPKPVTEEPKKEEEKKPAAEEPKKEEEKKPAAEEPKKEEEKKPATPPAEETKQEEPKKEEQPKKEVEPQREEATSVNADVEAQQMIVDYLEAQLAAEKKKLEELRK